ncbi:MAG: alkaline phosphatase [Oscillospiraceae bacterium]|nr:alkaline phosphatase [Oscillospiraceae bacterium]
MTNAKKILASLCAAATVITVGTAGLAASAANTKTAPAAASAAGYDGKLPKYIFMFIGDGMSFPQTQITADYYNALKDTNDNGILEAKGVLNFMNFPAVGCANTYDSSSFCPDSASTATSLSTGHKTYSGTINMDETFTTEYETITEKLKNQLGYKIGVVSTVNLNHATPAAYYAHQASRNSYYEIGVEMVESGFDYFAGGALKKPTGNNKDQTSVYDLAEQAGYNVITTYEDAEALKPEDGKSILIAERLADSDAMSYSNDCKKGEWTLSDYVAKGIEMLDNETGFFMMVEGGKIDWACHANDAKSTISDTAALSNSINEALKFYNEHPDETLIVVTGDHETGGLTIGYAGTDYNTYLTNLKNQKLSYAKFDSDYVSKYKANKTSFNAALKDVKKLFGLMTADDKDAEKNPNLVLTEYELSKLRAAYDKTMSGEKVSTQEEYVLYGSYEPLTVTITHILNNKSGINFASYAHTGLPVAVYAKGAGSALFNGYYDNTKIYDKLAALTGVN